MHPALKHYVTAAIANHLRRGVDEIEAQQHLRSDLGLNNLGLVSIALDLEDPKRGEFPFAALQDVDTVSDLVGLLDRPSWLPPTCQTK